MMRHDPRKWRAGQPYVDTCGCRYDGQGVRIGYCDQHRPDPAEQRRVRALAKHLRQALK